MKKKHCDEVQAFQYVIKIWRYLNFLVLWIYIYIYIYLTKIFTLIFDKDEGDGNRFAFTTKRDVR